MTIAPSHDQQEPRWRRQPEERPQQIVDAALDIFGERGLAGARLEDIARHAGISKGTIYLYFPNKEALFREVVQRTLVARLEEAEAFVAQTGGTALARLEIFMREWWRVIRTPAYTTVYRLVIAELHNFPDLARFYSEEVVVRAHRLVGGIIRQGVERGELRTVDPVVVTRMLNGLLVSHALWCGNRDSFPILAPRADAQVIGDLLDFVFHALRPETGVTTESDS